MFYTRKFIRVNEVKGRRADEFVWFITFSESVVSKERGERMVRWALTEEVADRFCKKYPRRLC